MTKPYRPLNIGPMPCRAIESTLQVCLSPGTVHFTMKAQEHAWNKHAADYMACLPYLSSAIEQPHYIGQHPKHPDGVEVYHSADGQYALIAIDLQPNDKGLYLIRSIYPVGQAALQRRLRMQQVFPAPQE